MKTDDTIRLDALQEIGDLSSEGVIIYSLTQNKVIYANAVVSSLVGLKKNDSQDVIESLIESVLPEDREYLMNRYSGIAKSDRTAEVEFGLLKGDNTEVRLCCNAYLISGKENIVAYIRDITRPKQHESYLVEFGAKKNTLLDTLVHHMSGALNLMRNLTVEAERSMVAERNENLRKYFSLIDANSRHCIEIINQLIEEEHSESPRVFVINTRFDLVEKVSYILQELKQSNTRRRFVFDCPAPSLHVNADHVKLLQVVNNLMSNAIKFTREGGLVRVVIRETAGFVIIQVEDDGIGIPEPLKPYLFDRRGKAGRTGLNGERSIGLGLSICQNLIQLMRGRIWFESTEGQGTSFYVQFPKE